MALKASAGHPRHHEIEQQLLIKREAIMKQSKEDLRNCIGNQDKTQVGDEMDLAATISREHFQASISKNHRKALQDIDRALMRIHDGSYGICVDCEEEIFPKRLNAFPLAKRCRECQEEHERELKRVSEARFEAVITD
jgi:DnaK suppressor protein